MKASEGQLGRVFVIRLEDGDMLPECIERFAAENGVRVGYAILVGGIGEGDIVVGPRHSQQMPPDPILLPIEGAHEISAVGVLAPDENGQPILHMHGALGRSGTTVAGCLRPGVKTWLVGEVVLYEIVGVSAVRVKDPASGFSFLEPAGIQPGAIASKSASTLPATAPVSPTPAQPASVPTPMVAAPIPQSQSVVARADTVVSKKPVFLFNAEVN